MYLSIIPNLPVKNLRGVQDISGPVTVCSQRRGKSNALFAPVPRPLQKPHLPVWIPGRGSVGPCMATVRLIHLDPKCDKISPSIT